MNPIIDGLLSLSALKIGSFTLKSGLISPIYVDLRVLIARPTLLRLVARAIWDRHTETADLICGVPYAALPIATVLSLDYDLPMVMRRKETKEHGTKQKLEGIFRPGDRVILVEDVITTGMSLLETTKDLEAAGLQVIEILAVLDREQGGCDALRQAGYTVKTALTLTDIATELFTHQRIDAATRDLILSQKKGAA